MTAPAFAGPEHWHSLGVYTLGPAVLRHAAPVRDHIERDHGARPLSVVPPPAPARTAERARPVDRSRTAKYGFPLKGSAPRRARRHTVEFARRHDLDAAVETAELLVSELMTNALEASTEAAPCLLDDGAAVAAPLELRLAAEHRRLRIEVRDHNPSPPVVNRPTFEEERGRGLLLVDTFSDLWGYRRLPTGGKVVWCIVSPDGATT